MFSLNIFPEQNLTEELAKLDRVLSLVKIMRNKCDDDVKALKNSLHSLLLDKKNFEKDKDLQV